MTAAEGVAGGQPVPNSANKSYFVLVPGQS